MLPLLKRLSEILSQELAQYSKLLELLSIKRYALVGNSAEQIYEILKQQETLILALKALEEARVVVMNKLAQRFQISAQKLTLLDLASRVEEPFASAYKELSQQFAELLLQLEQANRDNAYLIDRSLDYINSSLRLFAAADVLGAGYFDSKTLKPQSKGKHVCQTA